uniref:Uncharacterized protein n=1 Tax=Physcomitrium patens TaxID=3218 RepID=A0A2K1JMQ3_PHYPA|nr:hypothetical protein PHYPA_017649 [Physcomitrium patens]
MVVEHLFRNLKEMWKTLKNLIINLDLKKIPSLILACCLLHNTIIDKNNLIDESIVLWRHHNLGCRQKVMKNVP